MQFKRLKVLMLVLFFLLDIFLLNWWRAGQVPNEQITDANANIITEMKKQKIHLPKFSTTVQYSGYIAAQRGDKGTMTLPSGLNVTTNSQSDTVTVKLKTPELPKKETVISANSHNPLTIANRGGYRYNPVLTADKTNSDSVYSQRIRGLPVISDNGTMTFQYNKEGKITGFVQRQIVNVQRLRDDRATITEEEAIVALYRYNELDSGDRLSSGYLSYDKSLTVNGYDIYLPVWAFEAHSGNEKYILKINAFTGDNLSE
ncbi:two-component system regulatory protein YycI [Leuconostoc rapi]|uniref:two-component system regulatory protein YycI n=1 Tax=Leuconostoc rapi TaxID=1406906 RepID=UPI00195B6E11|nr:two-component system regulatory protein YycI [Leuconostoc rapi]MBM7435893.1 regulatory protein YycI of two-component signal transduction system YycFG [Leuconostoc rapi]